MLKDRFGKLGDAIPENLKEQAKEKLKEQMDEQLEGAKKRFFGDSAPTSSHETPSGSTERSEVTSAGATPTEAESDSQSEDSGKDEEVA